MNNSLEKFQDLLHELFQFDCADLDFGIYRIMNHKRDVLERFITQDLPKTVATELERGALAEQFQDSRELQDVATQIKATLGADALDADGNLTVTYHSTPLGKKYLSLQARATGARGREAIEAGIYNHLYAFFSRYYQDGDFISKRRYSKRERYAIPYNGEEVYLYWANNDQYYIKTAEHFTDYACTAPNGVSVHYLVYCGRIDHRTIVVIWRETEGLQKADFERDKQFVAKQKLAERADEVLVNGDSLIPGAQALEPIFKARMFALVEA